MLTCAIIFLVEEFQDGITFNMRAAGTASCCWIFVFHVFTNAAVWSEELPGQILSIAPKGAPCEYVLNSVSISAKSIASEMGYACNATAIRLGCNARIESV